MHCLFIFKHWVRVPTISLSFSGTLFGSFFPPFLPSFNGSGSASGSASVYVQHFPKYLPLFLPGSHDLRVIVTAAFMIDYRLELYDTHARMRACHKSPSKSPRSRSSVLLHLSYDRWMVDRQCTEHKLV